MRWWAWVYHWNWAGSYHKETGAALRGTSLVWPEIAQVREFRNHLVFIFIINHHHHPKVWIQVAHFDMRRISSWFLIAKCFLLLVISSVLVFVVHLWYLLRLNSSSPGGKVSAVVHRIFLMLETNLSSKPISALELVFWCIKEDCSTGNETLLLVYTSGIVYAHSRETAVFIDGYSVFRRIISFKDKTIAYSSSQAVHILLPNASIFYRGFSSNCKW